MSVARRLDRLQRRHPIAGYPIAVVYKYVDDSGGYLAALLTYYAFVSLFPLLLLLATVLGFVLSSHPSLQQQVLHSALSEFPVVGVQLGDPTRIGGGVTGLVVGIVGSLYGGLGVAQAGQYAMNTAWRVPRNSRPNPFKARGRSVLLLSVAGGAVLCTSALSAVGSGAGSASPLVEAAFVAASIALNAAIFVVVFRLAVARPVTVGHVLPGAVAAALMWQALQLFGIAYVRHVVRTASQTNGVFAVVLGLLAFLYLSSVAVVLCVEANVVRVERLYPRALLTPFTDNVSLTPGDRRAYTQQAQAERMKGTETVRVSFAARTSVSDADQPGVGDGRAGETSGPESRSPSADP